MNTPCPLGLYHAGHSLDPGRFPALGDDAATTSLPRDPAHVKTTYIRVNRVNPVMGVQRSITQEERRAVVKARPLVRHDLCCVLAEAYLREHPDSHEVMPSILDDWEREF